MMFDANDLEIPLEKQLRLRIINEEIDNCSDVDVLRENLKKCVQSLQTYQHLLNEVLKKQLEYNRNQLKDTMMEELKNLTNGN